MQTCVQLITKHTSIVCTNLVVSSTVVEVASEEAPFVIPLPPYRPAGTAVLVAIQSPQHPEL